MMCKDAKDQDKLEDQLLVHLCAYPSSKYLIAACRQAAEEMTSGDHSYWNVLNESFASLSKLSEKLARPANLVKIKADEQQLLVEAMQTYAKARALAGKKLDNASAHQAQQTIQKIIDELRLSYEALEINAFCKAAATDFEKGIDIVGRCKAPSPHAKFMRNIVDAKHKASCCIEKMLKHEELLKEIMIMASTMQSGVEVQMVKIGSMQSEWHKFRDSL